MDTLEIDATELQAITQLLDKLEGTFERLDTEEALHQVAVHAHELPSRLRLALNAFRLERMSGVLRIRGYQVDDDRLGPTPGHWRESRNPSPAHREELLLVMLSSLVGDPFGWATQQDGRLIHDIIPIQGHEQEQMGTSSEALLTWHTEDAFHLLRGDFLAFSCLRNPYAAVTTIGFVDTLKLTDRTRSVLAQPRFNILPDNSHKAKNNSPGTAESFAYVEEMLNNPAPVAVLFGDLDKPYIRADPYFMTVQDGDDEARAALAELADAVEDDMHDLRLEAGEFCFLDNFRVVHGRKPFKARFDGTDRWLKRVNVTSDLRKSRGARTSAGSRSIH
ncbi:clavaminate synthase family protein [Catenulispora yoronensis]|uniref:Clavaminate synthase family protein n=1 Tax=Catenulispora yoronensis TaxID=450799 RepID=A0ABP5H407_9ACTN